MSNTNKALANFENYLKTYAGRELLKNFSLDKTGIWKIKGEDPNADFHGHHYQPDLGLVEGTLRDAIMYGANLKQFWQWGAGGNFEFVGETIPKVDGNSVEVLGALREEQKKLEERLAEVKRQLGNR